MSDQVHLSVAKNEAKLRRETGKIQIRTVEKNILKKVRINQRKLN